MTPLALRAVTAPARRERRFGRAPLAVKLAIAFLGLVALVLIVNGAVDTYLTYNQAKRAALEVEGEKARGASERVSAFLSEIQMQLGWTTGVEWGYSKLEQQRYDFIRLLRQAPAITALSYIDGKGREQIAVSRLEPDAIASGKDFSADPRFVRAVAEKLWFGPVEFRRGSEPYMAIALAHVGKAPGVTVADVNLKLVWDVVSAIRVGSQGFAYVVDDHGRLIAHPDLSLVLRDSDFSHLPQVAEAMRGQSGAAAAARSFDGGAVLTAFAIEPKTHWAVFVEQPLSEALAAAYATLARAGGLLGLGLLLAAVTGVALARAMAGPIRLLQAGAERLGAGDLSQRLDIRSGDEIEALAGGFNRMAGQLQESYENLEAKVEARTRDLNEALERQTATAEILKVISASPTSATPVFDAIALTAARLFGCQMAGVWLLNGDLWQAVAGARPERLMCQGEHAPPMPLDPHANFPSQSALARKTLLVTDYAGPDTPPHERFLGEHFGIASSLFLPLTRGEECIGMFLLTSTRKDTFDAKEIALAESFRDQAQIAMENVRLFNETKEALERQTATAEILKVISNSPTDSKPVFDAISLTAVRLFGCARAGVFRVSGDTLIPVTAASPERLFRENELPPVLPIDPAANFPSRAVAGKATLRCDYTAPGAPEHERHIQERYGMKSAVFLPLLRAQECIGVFLLMADRSDAFSEADVALAESFRDQAMIAVENARLFNETQEALAQQTATADVLKVISRSAFDSQAVLEALINSAVSLTGSTNGIIWRYEEGSMHARAFAQGERRDAFIDHMRANPQTPGRGTTVARIALTGRLQHIVDAQADPDFPEGLRRAMQTRATLGVPMKRGDDLLGAIVMSKREAGAYPERIVELVKSFADQAVIAIENARLFDEVQARTRDLEQSLSELRKTQDRLVQSEKLASLGQLTAGIAHEIKNPLNFVNNFASLSRELLEELRETLTPLPADARGDADELMGMIDSNLEKVAHHGKRADSIVKNMLLHSREGSGERTRVNVNAMVEEALNLGYHGARAEKPGFNVTIEKSLDPDAGEADLYLQEVTRVLLNLISNGFYATDKRRQAEGPDYAPTLKASTRDLGHNVEIRIRDNGAGIADEVRAKMFNPFFTTKPAGEGTGLGLSLSHDIVVKQHGGSIDVETAPGAFTEFILTFPREGVRA